MADIEAIKANSDIVAVVGHYVQLKKRGAEFLGLCPFHADTTPSFYVIPAKNFCHCFACGASHDVIGFVQEIEGISFKQAVEKLNGGAEAVQWKPRKITQEAPPLPERVTGKPPKDAGAPKFTLHKLGEPSRVWTYRDGLGDVLGYVCRYETPEGKQIRAFTWGARGDRPAEWACGHWTKPRPLYGLDRLTAKPSASVLVVEGEKAADAAAELLPSYAVLTWPGGAQAWKHADLAPLRGRKVLLWPDADAPGIKAMAELAAIISDPKGLACSVRVIDPSGQPEGFDAADFEGTTDELIAWAKPRAKDYIAPQQNPAPDAESPLPAVTDTAAPDAGLTEDAPEPPTGDVIPIEAYASDPAAKPAKSPQRRGKRHLEVVDGNAARQPDPEGLPEPVSMSEDALAEHWAEIHGRDWRYVAEWGKWFKWCGDTWQEDKTSEVFQLARLLCRQAIEWPEAASLTPDGKRKVARKGTAGNVRDMASSDPRIAAKVDQWDTDPWLLGVPGGVVDLRTGKLMDGEPDQYITQRCSVAPAAGPHPLFDMVLARASNADADVTRYLWRWLGYMLTGDTREECFLFLHGPGGSGKGTLVKAIADILGDYARTLSMDALLESKQERHSQEWAKLHSARFVYSSETEEGRRWKESLIKWVTGRDKITARFMRGNDFEYYPKFKLLIYGNSIPHLKSVGEEMRRRVHLIEYAGSLSDEERDTSLKDRLTAEYPAILASMVGAAVEWADTGLGKPEAISTATSTYLQAEDTMGLWIEDNVERAQGERASSSQVYSDFKAWAQAAGEYVMSQKRFVQALQARGFECKRTASMRYVEGLKLRNPGMPSPRSYDRD